MPLRDRHLLWRLGEAGPDLLDELQALGEGEMEDFVAEGAVAHSRKLATPARAGKADRRAHRAQPVGEAVVADEATSAGSANGIV